VQINFYDTSLVGSSVFFSSNSITGILVKLGGLLTLQRKQKLNTWTHVGTIVLQDNGKLGLLEALRPTVVISDLEKRIKTCKDQMVLKVLDNPSKQKINKLERSLYSMVYKYEGTPYNTLGAILAGVDVVDDESNLSKWLDNVLNRIKPAMHCSYLDAKLKQECCIIPYSINCSECTPEDNFNFGVYSETIILK